MKKFIFPFLFLAIAVQVWAQAPQSMSYQAVIRNASNSPMITSPIGMQISVLQGSATGLPVFVEKHQAATNSEGIVTIQIGNGEVVSGSFANIDWANGPYFIKTETDLEGGSDYTLSGVSQLMSVPFALYANSSGSRAGSWDLDGNGGTTAANFIGTTDANAINFRVNNQPAGSIDSVSGNTFLGYRAGNYPGNVGIKNTVLGYDALFSNTTGVNNTAIGNSTMKANTTGSNNTAGGFCMLANNTTGGSNTAYGTWSLFKNTTASFNTAVGDSSLYSNTTGEGNSSVGYGALSSNTTGQKNTALGYNTLLNNTTGSNNTAIGNLTMKGNTTGSNNTASGFCMLANNTTGGSNTAYGTWALFKNSTASFNTAVGDSALYSNTTGKENVSVGYAALSGNTTGNKNTAVGLGALMTNTTGVNNTALGNASLKFNTTGSNNTAAGFCQLTKNTTGGSNTAYGTWALFNNVTANFGTAVGDSALYNNTTGEGNVAVGYGALVNNTNGSNNTAIGYLSDAGTSSHNSTVIGYRATTSKDNVIVLGNYSIRHIYSAQPSITTISDGRFKKNISTDIHGLDFITKLRPVSYNLDVEGLNNFQDKKADNLDRDDVSKAESIRHDGFIAQEVEKAAKAVNYNFSGLKTPDGPTDTYGLGYTDFVVPLVKAVQELNDQNVKLNDEVAQLKALLDKQTATIAGLQLAQSNNDQQFAELKKLVNEKISSTANSKK
ncbi:MAG: tail fiber domain-containing protein [Saprospiraceae bacterium]